MGCIDEASGGDVEGEPGEQKATARDAGRRQGGEAEQSGGDAHG
jgi:hypothetical protein